MARIFVFMIGVINILPAACAGMIWEIVSDQFKFGRRKAARALDDLAGVQRPTES